MDQPHLGHRTFPHRRRQKVATASRNRRSQQAVAVFRRSTSRGRRRSLQLPQARDHSDLQAIRGGRRQDQGAGNQVEGEISFGDVDVQCAIPRKVRRIESSGASDGCRSQRLSHEPLSPYSGERGWGSSFRRLFPLTPDPSPPSTGARGAYGTASQKSDEVAVARGGLQLSLSVSKTDSGGMGSGSSVCVRRRNAIDIVNSRQRVSKSPVDCVLGQIRRDESRFTKPSLKA